MSSIDIILMMIIPAQKHTMHMQTIFLLFICFFLPGMPVSAQSHHSSLKEIVTQAQSDSYNAQLAATRKQVSYYQFVAYKSEYKPQISFSGNAPSYNKQLFAVRQPNGAILYQSINQNMATMGLDFSQRLPFSGGTLSLNTDLTRFDDFNAKISQFNGTPVYLRLNQPLFAINDLKWNRKIEPLKFEESRKQFFFEIEYVAQQATYLYFNVLDAKNNMEIAEGNMLVAIANYDIEKKRINLGTTTEDRLLQLELQTLKNKQAMEKAKYDYTIAQLELKGFIGVKDNTDILPEEPDVIPSLVIDLSLAFKSAQNNRPEFVTFQRKMKEAKRDVVIAKAARQEVNLTASFGINGMGNQIDKVYNTSNSQQLFNIGFNVPIVDWGRRQARYNTAKTLEKLAATTNELDEAKIYQEITTLVKNIELLESNIRLAQNTDSLAQRRYTLATSLFKIGKLTVTDLNIAQSEKDDSRRSFINALRAYWNSYYTLRKLTLYDFEKQQSLITTE